jgi:hypothetical protein
VEPPLEQVDTVHLRGQHGLRLVDDRHATPVPARDRPVVIGRVDLVRLDPPQSRLPSVELEWMEEVPELPARPAGRQLRPDGARQRFQGVPEPRNGAFGREAGKGR